MRKFPLSISQSSSLKIFIILGKEAGDSESSAACLESAASTRLIVCLASPQGFGSVSAEHWLGNEYVYQLTSQRQYALRVELTDWDGHQAFSLYDRFQIGSEKHNYR